MYDTEVPSITNDDSLYPVSGVIVNVTESPSSAVTSEGEIVPPAEDEDVIVNDFNFSETTVISMSTFFTTFFTVTTDDVPISMPSITTDLRRYPSLRDIETMSVPPYATRTGPEGVIVP